MKFFPDERHWNHLDRKWITDVVNTMDLQGTNTMIANAMKKRKDKVEHSQDLLIDLKPEFAEALKKCLNFSSKLFIQDNLL